MAKAKEQEWTFSGVVDNFHTRLWNYHIKVPIHVSKSLIENGVKRMRVTLNEKMTIASGLMPAGDEVYFILINKKVRDTLKVDEGSKIEVHVVEDKSEYGMDMPDELQACLESDKRGNELFQKLTPGKQRNLIYAVGNVKKPDIRIHRALVILEHLKEYGGKIEFKVLNQALRVK